MALIWEIDFTSFSGMSDVALDNIGSQNLTQSSGIVKIPTVHGYTLRPGVAFTNNSVTQCYGVRSSSALNGCFNGSFLYRSFALWFYVGENTNNFTFWDNTLVSLWAEWNGTLGSAGFFNNGGSLQYRYNTSSNHTIGVVGANWHLLVSTCNKVTLESTLWLDGVLVNSSSAITDTAGGTYDCIIGDRDATREGTWQVGLAQTYDHILSSGEIQAMYSSFLKDSVIGNSDPYQSFSGTLYGLDGLTVSGAKHFSLYNPLNEIVHSGQTTDSGTFLVELPYSGEYSVLFTSTPSAGGRIVSAIANSGGVYFP